jgi:hypothetical protein
LVDASTDLRVMQVDLYKQGRSIEPSGSWKHRIPLSAKQPGFSQEGTCSIKSCNMSSRWARNVSSN